MLRGRQEALVERFGLLLEGGEGAEGDPGVVGEGCESCASGADGSCEENCIAEAATEFSFLQAAEESPHSKE
jgi:hypothetical protein